MNTRRSRTPLGLRVAARLLPPDAREDVLGDLIEQWHHGVRARSWPARMLWSWRQPVHALRARARFGGGEERVRSPRDAARPPGIAFSFLDVKLGLRMLAKHPGMTAVAVLAIGLGIPVGLWMSHLVRAFEAPLPVEEGERIQALRYVDVEARDDRPPSLYDLSVWREQASAFDALGAATLGRAYNLPSADGRPAEPVRGAEVTASTFDILRVSPALGRTLVPTDETPGAPDVVVLGYDLWTSRFAADPAVVGRTLVVSGAPHTVVGVMPKGFLFPARDRLWTALRTRAVTDDHTSARDVIAFGRLADGVSAEEADAQLATLAARLAAEAPELHAHLRAEVVSFPIGLAGGPRDGVSSDPDFIAMQLVSLLILVIACANVGMLIFARTAARRGELAIRTALGASRKRVVSQLFAEAFVLAAAAAAFGLTCGHLIATYVERTPAAELGLPYWTGLGLTRRTALVALGLAVLSAVIAGVVPALRVTGRSIQRNMQRAAAGATGVRFGGVSSALIVADVALSVGVCGMAVAFLKGAPPPPVQPAVAAAAYLSATVRVPPGDVALGSAADEGASRVTRTTTTQMELLERLAREARVRSVALGSDLPGMDHSMRLAWVDAEADSRSHLVAVARVVPGYFEAFGHPVAVGRGFGAGDLEGDRPVIVNTTFVERLLGGRNAVGQRVRVSWARGDSIWHEIVGVVDDLGTDLTNARAGGAVYLPAAVGELDPVRVAVHVGADPAGFATRLREIVYDADPTALLDDPVPLDQLVSFNRLFVTWGRVATAGLIGILLTLSVSGVYALMSFTVTERTREIGIRTALGARRLSIAATVARRSLLQLAAGVVLGIPVANLWLATLDTHFRSDTSSPLLTPAIAVAMLVVIGALACVAPTARALRITATEALREG